MRSVHELGGVIHKANRMRRAGRGVWNRFKIIRKVHLAGPFPGDFALCGRLGLAVFTDAVLEQRAHHPHLFLELGHAGVSSLTGPPPLRRHEDAGLFALCTSLALVWCGRVGQTADLETSARLAGSVQLLRWCGLACAWFTMGSGGGLGHVHAEVDDGIGRKRVGGDNRMGEKHNSRYSNGGLNLIVSNGGSVGPTNMDMRFTATSALCKPNGDRR